MLELKNITKVYETGSEKVEALKGVSLKFRESEFVSILGQSGCGKTTLLNIIGGLDRYTTGDLIINGKSTKKFRNRDWDAYRNYKVGFVFQSYNLISHQTVLSNVELALTIGGISKKERSKKAIKALEEVGLKEQIYKKPNQLSGGQMQRVAIARALVNDPDIILADEPTGALDTKTSVQVMEILKKISKDKLIVMVTHNSELAQKYSTRIINILDGEITHDSNPIIENNENGNINDASIGRTSMSFFTAFRLSLNNLLTKKGRTILVAFAGSIGIIGIALVQSVSNGFQSYVDQIEEDALTSYPLTIMQETTDVTGTLLAMTAEREEREDIDGVKEAQYISKMLANLSTNDLKSFRKYFEENYKDKEKDLSSIKYSYSVEPNIYAIDKADTLAKLNPSNLIESPFGENSIMNSYSSIYSQMIDDQETLNESYDVLAGNWPQEYNEMIIVLNEENSISDLLLYSLGMKNTAELKDVMNKIMNGESVEINSEEPLTLSYEDLMNIDIRLIMSSDTFRYNEEYDIYEDMTEDKDYMQNLFDNATKLKIVGVVSPKDGVTTTALNPGVAYKKELINYIIDYSAGTDIVKKQLENEEIDVLSGSRFDETKNNLNLDFSDLISVDAQMLQSAFNVKVNEEQMQSQIEQYIKETINNAAENSQISLEDILSNVQIPQDTTNNVPDSLPDSIPDNIENYVPSEAITREDIENYINNNINQEEVVDQIASNMAEAVMARIGDITSNLTNSMAVNFNVDQGKIARAFKMKMTEEELTRVISAMLTTTKNNAKTNLIKFGYQEKEEPTYISFYFKNFDGKENFKDFIKEYNKKIKDEGEDDKEINYTDTTGILMGSVKTIVNAVTYVLIAFISISLVVSSIMIGIITYISVYERTKEIGILRAIGASKHNISSIFNAETFIIGLLSGAFGIGITYAVVPVINRILHHFTGNIPLNAVFYFKNAITLLILSVILTIIGGLIPAKAASKKDPVIALRTE